MSKSNTPKSTDTPTRVSQAVANCINRLAIAQQNMRAYETIMHRMRDKGAVSQATVTEMHKALYADIVRAWNDLSFFAPISAQALNLLSERSRTWFERDDTSVMHWLDFDFTGSYHTSDKEAFLAEVRAMFTGVPHNTD